jgi:hypothetical protein
VVSGTPLITEKASLNTFQKYFSVDEECTEYKYLGMEINREGTHDPEINKRIKIGRYAISILNSVLWDKTVTKRKEKCIYNTVIKSIATYGCEVWQIKEKE